MMRCTVVTNPVQDIDHSGLYGDLTDTFPASIWHAFRASRLTSSVEVMATSKIFLDFRALLRVTISNATRLSRDHLLERPFPIPSSLYLGKLQHFS